MIRLSRNSHRKNGDEIVASLEGEQEKNRLGMMLGLQLINFPPMQKTYARTPGVSRLLMVSGQAEEMGFSNY